MMEMGQDLTGAGYGATDIMLIVASLQGIILTYSEYTPLESTLIVP